MNIVEQATAILPYAFAIAIVMTSLYFLGKVIYLRIRSTFEGRRQPTEEDIEALAFSMVQEIKDSIPKCVCGGEATHMSPRLVRKRNGWLRAIFAIAPSYRRVVPRVGEALPTLCETHAHVADAMMDRFIFERIRGVQAEANEKISVEASTFERDRLLEQIQATLEEPEKKSKSIPPKSAEVVRLLGT